VTAYQLTPVGASGPEPDRTQEIEIPSVLELRAENERLKVLLAETIDAREAWASMWHDEVNRRLGVQNRLNRSMRVLASLGRLSPRMAAVVESARREIWRLDE